MGPMRFRIFQYPLPAPPELEDLNRHLATQRVATVTHHMVATPGGAMLVFVVEAATAAHVKAPVPGPGKDDYQAELSAEDFAVFERLREARKGWAEAEGVPLYAIFTNKQLAAMAKSKATTPDALLKVEGMSAARVERYGERLLAVLANTPQPPTPEAAP